MSPSVEPFDEAKYKALMDGLECSEILMSSVKSTTTLRFDSDYYKKEYLEIERYINDNQSKFTTLSKMGLTVDASAFYPALEPYYNSGTIPFIRVADVKDSIDYDNCIRIPKMGEEYNTLNLCHAGDVVLTKGGRVGTAGLITQDSYVTRDLVFINSSKLNRNDYIMLYLFYCSNFAQKQMTRSSSMTAQPHLTITLIKDVDIYLFSDSIKKSIVGLFDQAEMLEIKSREGYKCAAATLESFLKLASTKTKTTSTYIKRLSDSLAISGRLDAEYYQPKYESIAQKLNTSETVRSLCKLYDKNFVPQDKESYQYIELADVGQSGDISDVDIQYGSDLPTRARRIVKSGQIIVSSVEGSLQSCALITDEYDGALCSTGFYVLDSDCINSETLLVLFKSEPIQALMKQRCSGSILAAIGKDEFLSMPLPKINGDIQKEIAFKVQESFALRRKSKQLLEYAKKAVEMAIEQGEDVALEWLKERTDQ